MISFSRWVGAMLVEKSEDPDLQVGKVYWFEVKEPTLTRPIQRMRYEVVSKEETGFGGIEYQLRAVTQPTVFGGVCSVNPA